MEMNNFCLVIATTFLIIGVKHINAAQLKTKMVTFSKPLFFSDQQSRELLKSVSMIGTAEMSECLNNLTEKAPFDEIHRNTVEPSSSSEALLGLTQMVTTTAGKKTKQETTTVTEYSNGNTEKATTDQTQRKFFQSSPKSEAYVTGVQEATKTGEVTNQQDPLCPPWTQIGDSAYMVRGERQNYSTSRKFCQDCGGDLAVLKTSDVETSVQTIMRQTGITSNNVWIGIVRVQSDQDIFLWLDHRDFPLNDSSWMLDQPNNNPSPQDCIASVSYDNWKLHDRMCSNSNYALCQRNKLDDAVWKDWTLWNNSYYLLDQTEISWEAAKNTCYSYTKLAHVVFIESDEEHDFVKTLTDEVTKTSEGNRHAWLGLYKQDGSWGWYDTPTEVQTTGKRQLHASADHQKNCACMKLQDNNRWEGRQCTDKYIFICEVEEPNTYTL